MYRGSLTKERGPEAMANQPGGCSRSQSLRLRVQTNVHVSHGGGEHCLQQLPACQRSKGCLLQLLSIVESFTNHDSISSRKFIGKFWQNTALRVSENCLMTRDEPAAAAAQKFACGFRDLLWFTCAEWFSEQLAHVGTATLLGTVRTSLRILIERFPPQTSTNSLA